MRPFRKTLGPYAAADADGISASQTPSAAGNLLIDGALASGGIATLDTERNVLITSAGDDSDVYFEIYGRDAENKPRRERITGANAGTVRSTHIYKYVDRIYISGAASGAVTAGTTSTNTSEWVPCDWNRNPPNTSVAVDVVSGTLTFSIEKTYDELHRREPYTPPTSFAGPADLTAKTADAEDTIVDNVTGVRLVFTAYTSGSVILTVAQAGIVGN